MMISVKTRLLFGYGLILLVIIVLFDIALVFSLNSTFDNGLKNSLKSIALDIKNDELNTLDKLTSPVIANKEEFAISPVFIEVWETENIPKRILYTKNLQNLSLPTLFKSGLKEIDIPFISKKDQSALFVIKIKLHKKNYLIKVATPLDKLDDSIEDFITVLIFLSIILFLIAFYFGFWMLDLILKPMKIMTNTAHTISQSNLSKRIKLPPKKDEFYFLAKTFNEMLGRLEKSFNSMKKFNTNVSHELKTPLTIIKGEIELALKKQRDIKEYQKTLKVIDEETLSMQNIIDNLLLVSKTDIKAFKKDMKEISLDYVLLQTYEEFLEYHKYSNIILLQIESVKITGEPFLLKRAVFNIIDNAVKYSSKTEEIKIALYKQNNQAIILIEDKGKGMDRESLQKITQPFYRIDDSRSKKIKGYGLGLSIVKWIMDLHCAKIEISSQKQKGTKVKLIFNSNSNLNFS